MMMMTFITRRGEGQGKTKKERKATKSKGRGLEEGASRALMRQHGEEGCGEILIDGGLYFDTALSESLKCSVF